MKHNIYILLHACSATVRLLHSWAVHSAGLKLLGSRVGLRFIQVGAAEQRGENVEHHLPRIHAAPGVADSRSPTCSGVGRHRLPMPFQKRKGAEVTRCVSPPLILCKCMGYACRHVCMSKSMLRNAVLARHADTRTLAVRLTRAACVRSVPLRDADRHGFARWTSTTETKSWRIAIITTWRRNITANLAVRRCVALPLFTRTNPYGCLRSNPPPFKRRFQST